MPDDPLAKWRRPGTQAPSPAVETESESKVIRLADYRREPAGESGDGWLELRPLKGPWALCSYAQLRKVLFNGPKPTRIDLIFSYERVTVKGRGLEALLPGLRARTLACIEQLNPAGQNVPGQDVPIVESIESKDNAPPAP
jgi:hypothetical protein